MIRGKQDRAGSSAGLDFKRLFEGAPGLFLVLAPDPDLTILGASDAYLRATLTERESIIGRRLFEAFSAGPDDPHADALRASLERLLAGGASEAMAVQRRDIRRPDKDGGGFEERYWKPTNSTVLGDAGDILYLIHRLEDVTDFVRASLRAEQESARAESLQLRTQAVNAELEQATRELEGLSYSVSHDLRAPLRAIDGFSRILEEDFADRLDGEGVRVISVIRESSARMGLLMEEMLAFSRLAREPMSCDTLDMFRMAGEAFEEACAGAARAPELVLHPLPQARGDARLMRRVWMNLLANAVKFSGTRERAVIEVSGRENGADIVYSVRDNGVGFDMRYHDRLFGVFQKLHREEEFPGTGIGLATVQRIVARHGGRVWAEGRVDAGAAFHFALPGNPSDVVS